MALYNIAPVKDQNRLMDGYLKIRSGDNFPKGYTYIPDTRCVINNSDSFDLPETDREDYLDFLGEGKLTFSHGVYSFDNIQVLEDDFDALCQKILTLYRKGLEHILK